MNRVCTSLDQVVADILWIVNEDKARSGRDDGGAEYFFRGEQRRFIIPGRPETAFDPVLDRDEAHWKHERELYEEAMRLNVASFSKDRTMCERIARMQHYRLPTRFADLSANAFLTALFACDGCSDKRGGCPDEEGIIRVFKVAKRKMKSFTSDIIVAISHLPLVKAEDVHVSRKQDLGYLEYEVQCERPGFSLNSYGRREKSLYEEIQQVWAFKPLMNNPRIRNQGGLFLAFGCRDGKEPLHPTFSPDDYDNPNAPSCGIAQVGIVRIAASAKETILDQLRMFGMTEEVVYPDLENVCKTLDKRFKARFGDG